MGYRGKALMDFIDKRVQPAYFLPAGDPAQEQCRDFMWYLWCGAKSPVYGKYKMTTFEHYFVEDKQMSKAVSYTHLDVYKRQG